MTARDILRTVHAHGAVLAWHSPERLRLTPPGVLPPDLRQAIQEHREELLTLLEAFEERAAIAEYCAGLPRAEAAGLAWACVLEESAHAGCAACGYPDAAQNVG